MAPGYDNVEGGFVRELMLLLEGISVGEQITQDREGSPCITCDKAIKSLQTPNHAHNLAEKWPNVCLQALWKKVQDQQQHQQTQEAFWLQASPQEELLQLFHVGQWWKRGKMKFCPAPGRGKTSSTMSIGNVLFGFE